MRDSLSDPCSGPPPPSRPPHDTDLRIATWRWRLRLFSGITVGVLVMEGWGVALVFTAAIGIVASAELAVFILGVAVGVLCDRFLLAPLAVLMERVERRWHGRLRAR